MVVTLAGGRPWHVHPRALALSVKPPLLSSCVMFLCGDCSPTWMLLCACFSSLPPCSVAVGQHLGEGAPARILCVGNFRRQSSPHFFWVGWYIPLCSRRCLTMDSDAGKSAELGQGLAHHVWTVQQGAQQTPPSQPGLFPPLPSPPVLLRCQPAKGVMRFWEEGGGRGQTWSCFCLGGRLREGSPYQVGRSLACWGVSGNHRSSASCECITPGPVAGG